MSERTVYDDATWGIDRIDSRTGTDGSYDDSGSTGAGTRIYILDTGVYIGHNDFGGRAVGGWSDGCQSGTETGCGSTWGYQGVVGNGCGDHGTHCASTAAGSEYGVAKGATIVAVQVRPAMIHTPWQLLRNACHIMLVYLGAELLGERLFCRGSRGNRLGGEELLPRQGERPQSAMRPLDVARRPGYLLSIHKRNRCCA